MIWLRTHLYAILLGAKALLLALAYAKGRKDANETRETQDMRADHDTRKRIDKVTRGSSADADRDFLRDRGQR
jgi:V8-like Glu-specific endopeptidase